MRIAQISLSLSGGFWPVSLPLFQGFLLLIWFKVSILIPSVVDRNQIMTFSSSKGDTQKTGVGGNLRQKRTPSNNKKPAQWRDQLLNFRLSAEPWHCVSSTSRPI
jgi:hypothetical protein